MAVTGTDDVAADDVDAIAIDVDAVSTDVDDIEVTLGVRVCKFNSMLPGPSTVKVVEGVVLEQVSPPVQVQLRTLYPVGRLHAVMTAEPNAVV